jgi:hypothetical protein
MGRARFRVKINQIKSNLTPTRTKVAATEEPAAAGARPSPAFKGPFGGTQFHKLKKQYY